MRMVDEGRQSDIFMRLMKANQRLCKIKEEQLSILCNTSDPSVID